MKGYKATLNGVCKDFLYEIGKTYELKPNDDFGFSFCINANIVLDFYDLHIKGFKLFEIDTLDGNVSIDSRHVYSFHTDKIKIIREIQPNEYKELFNEYEIEFDKHYKCLSLSKKDGNFIFRYEYNEYDICTGYILEAYDIFTKETTKYHREII